jgi:CheY-like chemotaxis protein
MRVEEFFAEDQSNQINELESELWQRSEALSAKNVYETTDGRRITLLTRKAPVADDAGASSVMFAVATDVSGHVRNENRLAEQAHALRERVKEVSCLYDVSRTLLECDGTITSDVLGRIARRIPAGWQYPQITEARVQLGDEVGETSGFRQTDWMLHHHTGEGSLRAAVDVAYVEAPEQDGPTFIPEERQLLALELFEREETIDMVITDVVMPQMSGLELLDELRDRNVGVPILLISGYAKPEILEGRDGELGDSFLHKPFNATELIERVSDLIE